MKHATLLLQIRTDQIPLTTSLCYVFNNMLPFYKYTTNITSTLKCSTDHIL